MLRRRILELSRASVARPLSRQPYRVSSFSSTSFLRTEDTAAEPTPDPRDKQITDLKVFPLSLIPSSNPVGQIRKIAPRLQKPTRTKQTRTRLREILRNPKICARSLGVRRQHVPRRLRHQPRTQRRCRAT